MNKLEFRQEIGRSYLVAECQEKEENEYLISMITENRIRGFLTSKIVYEERKRKIFYDVTNKISLENEYSNKNIDIEDITELFSNISLIYTEGRKYLLEEKFFVINPEYIFFDPISNEFSFMYLPDDSSIERLDNPYEILADFLLQKVNQHNQLAVKITYMFYKMTKINTFSLEAFREIIDKEISIDNSIKKKNDLEQENQTDFEQEMIDYEEEVRYEGAGKIIFFVAISLSSFVLFMYFKKSIYSTYILLVSILSLLVAIAFLIKFLFNLINNRKEAEMDFYMKNANEEDYWCDSETQVFSDETEIYADNMASFERELTLSWKENGKTKKYSVSSYPVIIGKKASEVDCCISEQSVSRIHAKLEKQNGKLYLKDMSSTNGTLVDGQRIDASSVVEIQKESEIQVGNVQIRLI